MAYPSKAQIRKKKIKSKIKKCFSILLILGIIVAGVGLLKTHNQESKFMKADASSDSEIRIDHSSCNTENSESGEHHFSLDVEKNKLEIGW